MMSLDSFSKHVHLRRIYSVCAIMAYAILSSLPIGAAAQVIGGPPVLNPGLHDRMLTPVDAPAIRYAISIPKNYSPSTPVPLILALHFGVRGATRPAPAGMW